MMACPVNSTTGICDLLAETGAGLGEFSNQAVSNGGLPKFLFMMTIIFVIGGLVVAVGKVISKSVDRSSGKGL